MKVSEIMSAPVFTVDPEGTLAEATTLMGERKVSSALVLDGQKLAGILTERDVVRALSNAHDAATRPVAEWMTRNPVTISPDAEAREALDLMLARGFRHLPVSSGDRVVGMLSIRDLARALAD